MGAARDTQQAKPGSCTPSPPSGMKVSAWVKEKKDVVTWAGVEFRLISERERIHRELGGATEGVEKGEGWYPWPT